MKIIIGVDTHIATCDYFAVSPEGRIVGEGRFDTSASGFRKMLSAVKGSEKYLVIEQGPLANWIRRITRPHVARVVVAEPRRNRWIAKDSVKNDRFDAEKLATLYRGGFVTEVVARNDKNQRLFQAVVQHHQLVRQYVQVKNKIKAKFRENGMRAAGKKVFSVKDRDYWTGQLVDVPHLLKSVKHYYEQLDLLASQIKETDEELEEISRQYTIVKTLIDKFPGIGLINASTFVALIDTPERFSTVKKLWIYCGLGIDRRSSGQRAGIPQLTRRGNRLLKYILKNAIRTAIRCKDNPYQTWYRERIEAGAIEYKVILTLTRKLAKDMWLTWRQDVIRRSRYGSF